MIVASFPSPEQSVWDLGPVPLRAYALCIIVGIIAAVLIGERRWVERGGKRGTVSDISSWAIVSGLIGGRLYHVITDNELYFRAGRDPWEALYIWEGGLGIWGAIGLGGVGVWIACRRHGISLRPFADAVAPAIAVGQSIGRWGNYYNQELFGRPTDLPWAVEIDPGRPGSVAGVSTYHPTFLYESLWTMALAVVLIVLDRRYRMGRGRVFALFLMGYTLGRVWIELLRIDTANELFGTRINVWTSIVVFLGALAYFLRNRGPRETDVEPSTPALTAADTPVLPAATKPAATPDPSATPAPATATTAATATATATATKAAPEVETANPDLTHDDAATDPAEEAGTEPAAGKAEAGTEAEPGGSGATAAGKPAAGGTGAQEAAAGEAAAGEAGAAAEPTAEEQVAATATDEPLTVERRRRLLPTGRRKR